MSEKIFFVALFVCQFLQYCYANDSYANNVFVSILPQKYFVERIAGEHVGVSVMVRKGQSPETYEPTPKQMTLLGKSQLYFQIGIPFESIWINAISELNSDLKIIECCTELNTKHNKENISVFEKNMIDPHIWTSPANVKYIALKIKNALIDNYPIHKKEFEFNYHGLIKDLDKLDQDIESSLAQLNNRYIIVSHPAFGHYAEAYNLIQLSIETEGKEVRTKSLTNLIKFAKSKNIKKVFSQKQFNKNYAEILAREISAYVVDLDPLAEDYIANLYYITNAISDRKD